jgi:cysteine synthase
MSKKNVLEEGSDTILEYLNPGKRLVPMIELPQHLNPYHKNDVRIQAQVWGDDRHIKYVPAFMMLVDAYHQGRLDGVHTLVENTSGNTIEALGFLAPYFGIKKVVAVIPKDLAQGKMQTIQRLGIEYRTHGGNGVAMAEELGKQPGWHNLNQYRNESNIRGHYEYTAPQIDRQTDGMVRIIAMSVGTSGTLCGVSKYFREKIGKDKFTSVAIICAPGAMVPGARSRKGLLEVSFEWEKAADKIIEVGTAEAYFTCQRLGANGFHAGPTSGLAYRGLLDFLALEEVEGRLETYRNEKGIIEAVVIFPDGSYKYGDKIVTLVQQEALSSDRSILS